MANNGNGYDQRGWVLSALDQYESRLIRYAARILGDEDAARDAVQHAFLRLCDQDREQLDGRLAPWLYTVCRNKAVDQLRRSGRHESLDGESLPGSPTRQITGRETDPAVAAERRDLAAWLRSLVDALPSKLREVIDLWLDGFSYREIAEITSRSDGHIRVMVHRALTRLREHPQIRELLNEQAIHKTLTRQST